MDLLLVRHGQPEHKAADPGDPPLSGLGHRQAEAVARLLAEEQFDAIWSSNMARAVQTADAIAKALGLPVEIDCDLAEFDRGTTQYLHFEDASQSEKYQSFLSGDLSPWDTTATEFRGRVVAAIERIIAASAGRRVIVVSHGGAINAYLGHLLQIEQLIFHDPTYTGFSRVRANSRGLRTVISVNETGHLRQALRR